MAIEVTIQFEDGEQGAKLLADVFLMLHGHAGFLGLQTARGNNESSTSKDQEGENLKSNGRPPFKRKTPSRQMGGLKREVFEAYEKHSEKFLTMQEGALLCGKTTVKIKSTVNGAYRNGEFERKMKGDVFAYRIGTSGLALLEGDRNIRAKSNGPEKAA
ncbi:hypothetical protein ACYOEI_01145 [Singulisphaera rosea]